MSDDSLIYLSRPALTGEAIHPGLILLHGLGSDENDLLSFASRFERFFVASVRAPFAYRGGGYMWFDVEAEGPGLGGKSIERSLHLLRRTVVEITSSHPIDSDRVVMGGFSMGAAMAGAFSLLHPDMVLGAVMLSGFLPADPTGRYQTSAGTGLPVFQAHGTVDQVLPLEYGRLARRTLESTSVTLTYKEYDMGHQVIEEELDDLAVWLRELSEPVAADNESNGA
jgi:phospholipase/carboxylesterase